MYRNKTELYSGALRILREDLPPIDESCLARNLAHCQTEMHFSEWDRVPKWQKKEMIDGFLKKYSLKSKRKPATPEDAQRLLEEHYLSYEYNLESLYKHWIGIVEGQLRLSKMGSPEPMTDLRGQAFIPFNGAELI